MTRTLFAIAMAAALAGWWAAGTPTQLSAATAQMTHESAAWRKAQARNTRNAYQQYLQKYPRGKHAREARRRLARQFAVQGPSGAGGGAKHHAHHFSASNVAKSAEVQDIGEAPLSVARGRVPAVAAGARAAAPLTVDAGSTRADLSPVDDGSRAKTSAYWNSWFEVADEPTQEPLTINVTYTFVLDLSPFEYAKMRPQEAVSAAVDPEVEKVLSDPRRKFLTFKIKPLVAQGSGLQLQNSTPVDFRITLDRIRHPNLQMKERYENKEITIRAFSEDVTAGQARIQFSASQSGCFALALAILDETGRFPLDHLVRWIAVNSPGRTAPPCGDAVAGGPRRMHSGLASLLETSLEVQSSGTAELASAAFLVFEPAPVSDAGSFVIFVDGRSNQTPTVYAWNTVSSIVGRLNNDQGLPMLIGEARDLAGKGRVGSYAKAARELEKVFFPRDNDDAQRAESAFKQLVKQSSVRPVVVVRVVSELADGQKRSVFVPLGILGAKAEDGSGAVLSQPITVVQPLPRERYDSDSNCIGDWTFVLPNELQGLDDLSQLWSNNSPGIHDFAKFQTYLGDNSPIKEHPGQGLLLLAHHGKGNLWFERETDRVIAEDVVRRYPPGSVGVFAACSTAAAYDDGFLRQFNQHGVDALIASPFAIPAVYGTRLAAVFPQAVAELRPKNGHRATISELFAHALELTAKRLKDDKPNARYDEIGLEYVLLGNPSLVLCPEAGAPPQ